MNGDRFAARATSGCDRLPPALVQLLVDSTAAPLTQADDDHFRACRHCRTEITELALAGHAVRRAVAAAAVARPPQNAWQLLRRRLERRSPPIPAYATSAAGTALGVAIAITLVLPFDLRQPVLQDSSGPQAMPPVRALVTRGSEDIAEGRWLRQNLLTRAEVISIDVSLSKDDPRRYGEDSQADRPPQSPSTLPMAVE